MKHPLSINFKTFRQYDFCSATLDQIVFFEWLLLKKAFYGNTFFYQQKRIINELGIKRNRLETIKGQFIELGLEVEQKGFNNVTHYCLSSKFIKAFIRSNVKAEYQQSLLRSALEFEINSEETLNENDLEITKIVVKELNRIYNERRELKSTDIKKLTDTELPVNGKTLKQINRLLDHYSERAIFNSFIAFCDDQLDKKDHAHHMLNNFSAFNKKEGKFGNIEWWLSKFNREYVVSAT